MAKGWRKAAKGGTKNKDQAEKRDKAAAARRRKLARGAIKVAEAVTAAATARTTTPVTVRRKARGSPEHAALQRSAIALKYKSMGCPTSDKWDGHGGTVAIIHEWLPDASSDRRQIRDVLERYSAGEDLIANRAGQGGEQALTQAESLIAYDALRAGRGQDQAACIVSSWREPAALNLLMMKKRDPEGAKRIEAQQRRAAKKQRRG